MASCSRPALVALLASCVLLPGCWTGRAFELGRVRESVVSYDRAFLDDERILLDYSVQLASRNDEPFARKRRAVAIPREALAAQPEYAVDAFPVEPIRRGQAEANPERAIPVVAAGAARDALQPPFLEVIEGDAGVQGFRLCAGAGPCERMFRSEALYRDRTAWWVYPLLPLTAALDVAFLPLHAIGLAPFFLIGD